MSKITEDLMGSMAKMALEQATSQIAQVAREQAMSPVVKMMSGPEALLNFAEAIEKTNAKAWPVGEQA